jgi:hypothetical protein
MESPQPIPHSKQRINIVAPQPIQRPTTQQQSQSAFTHAERNTQSLEQNEKKTQFRQIEKTHPAIHYQRPTTQQQISPDSSQKSNQTPAQKPDVEGNQQSIINNKIVPQGRPEIHQQLKKIEIDDVPSPPDLDFPASDDPINENE